MACKFYEPNIDVCGLCDLRSDFFDETAHPDNHVDGVCNDAENAMCFEYEEEDYESD